MPPLNHRGSSPVQALSSSSFPLLLHSVISGDFLPAEPTTVRTCRYQLKLSLHLPSLALSHSLPPPSSDGGESRRRIPQSSSDWAMDAEYKPPPEFELDTREPLIDINLTDSQELWLIRLPFGEDLLNDLDGQLLSLNLHGNDGQLSSFEGSSGKVYDFISDDTKKVNEYVFISSSTNEPKIAGMISRHVSVVHYPDPEELEMRMNPNNPKRNPSGNDRTTYSQPFPKKSYGSGHAASTQGSRPKSSLSEVGEQSNNPKRRRTAESEDYTFELSRGHSSGISVASSDQSHGVKSKRRSKHEE